MNAALVRIICFDWGDTLMLDDGPQDLPMALWPEVHVVQGALQMLDRLHGRFPLCIATNATMARKPMVEQALERGGMLHYFSDVFTFTELGVKKDTPEFWRVVATMMGVAVDEIAMLGDTLVSDVLAPSRYGVQSVWFNPRGLAVSPGVTAVRRLEDFPALFD